MAKDPSIESHIADSKVKIEKAAPEAADTERHVDRTKRALERARVLLEQARDPFELGRPKDVAAGKGRVAPPKKSAARKAKPKSRR